MTQIETIHGQGSLGKLLFIHLVLRIPTDSILDGKFFSSLVPGMMNKEIIAGKHRNTAHETARGKVTVSP